MTKSQMKFVAESYAKYFGRAADADTIKYYGEKDNGKAEKASKVLNNIIADAGVYKGDIPNKQVVNEAFQNLFGRDAYTTEMNKYIKFVEKGKNLPINSIVKSAAKTDKAVYNNKMAVAVKYAELGGKGDLDLSKISRGNLIDLKTVFTLPDLQTQYDALPENSGVPTSFDGKTYNLTTNVDSGKDFVGTAKNDLFLATQKDHWSIADSIDGGKGVDTLKIIDNNNVAFDQDDLEPISATIKNVEIIDIINNNTITVDTTSITGVTHLYTTSKGGNTSTAAATTDINVKETDLKLSTTSQLIVNGGKDITVNATGTTNNTTALTPADGTGAEILVGATTAAAGKVNVTNSFAGANNNTSGDVFVKGGTEVTVTQKLTNTTVAQTNVQGAVSVVGNASTKTVTVNQDATVTAGATVVGKTAGAVTIADAKAGHATDANTITTVTLKNAGAATVKSNALSTLNLEGTLVTVDASNATGTGVTTLALNLKGAKSTGAVTADAEVTTLNVNSSTTASTLTALVANGATAINVSGDAALTITNLTATAANKVITVTNSKGVTIGSALGTDVKFTGGAGADSIILSANYTKAINMGAGDDTVVYAVAGAGGSLNGGDGNDTLVVSADSAIAGLPEVSGFEVLKVKGASAAGGTTHNAHTFKDLEVGTNTVNTTFTNVAAGVGLTVLEANVGITTKVTLANATGTADVFNLTLKSALAIDAGTVDLAGVETINVNSVDTGSVTAAHVNDLVLTAADAKSIVVTGDAGVDFGATALTKVTNFDASAVTAGDVTFVSGNTTLGEVVTIKGGAGDDTLTGHVNTNDTIIGGAGDDTLVYTGRADTFTGGAGNDTFEINALGTKALHLTITDLTKGDIIDISGIDTGTATWNNAKVALGASATFDEYLDAASAGNGSANSIARWFQFEGNTYLVNDNTAGATFAATDAVVKITGLVDLGTSTLSGTDLTIA